MRKFLIGGLILTLSLGFISCPTGNDDNNPVDKPKVVEEKYRGRFENVAFSGNWYVITENTIEDENSRISPAWTIGAELWSYEGGTVRGIFIDENTFVDSGEVTHKRVTQ